MAQRTSNTAKLTCEYNAANPRRPEKVFGNAVGQQDERASLVEIIFTIAIMISSIGQGRCLCRCTQAAAGGIKECRRPQVKLG